MTNQTNEHILNSVNQWLDQVVIGLNLCPFASKPFRDKQIRLSISQSTSDANLLEDLQTELNYCLKANRKTLKPLC